MEEVIIIGGGISAFTAGLFTARRGLSPLIIGKDVGGQANSTDTIENYPGIESIGGYELTNKIRGQAEFFGAKFLEAEVSKIKPVDGAFVIMAYGQQLKAKTVILAHGKTPRDLGVVGEQELKGKGISYCATCDAPLFKDLVVTVAGIGNVAADAGLLAAHYAKKVFILSKTDKFIAHASLHKALFRKKNVELLPFVQIQQILGEHKVERLSLLDLKTGKPYDLTTDALLVELGYIVNSDFVRDLVALDTADQIIVDSKQVTSVPGIFACGDATNRLYKQAVISAGDAATAGLAAYEYLMGQKGALGQTSDWTEIKKVK